MCGCSAKKSSVDVSEVVSAIQSGETELALTYIIGLSVSQITSNYDNDNAYM